MEYF
jgi:protein-tyrosine phosphatase